MVGEVADEGFAAEPHTPASRYWASQISSSERPSQNGTISSRMVFFIFFADLKRILRSGAHGIEFVAFQRRAISGEGRARFAARMTRRSAHRPESGSARFRRRDALARSRMVGIPGFAFTTSVKASAR